jgi:hypothetical protein
MREDITTIERNGVTVELQFDEDGFPLVIIDTGSSYRNEVGRPTVDVQLNESTIHEMFDENCVGWGDA